MIAAYAVAGQAFAEPRYLQTVPWVGYRVTP